MEQGHISMLVIGDSHSLIWGGNNISEGQKGSKFPHVSTVHLGPALAFNLMKDLNSPGKWGNRIFRLIEQIEAPVLV